MTQQIEPGTGNSAELVSLGDERKTLDVLASSVLGLWEVVNNLTRLRPTRRRRTVGIRSFTSASPSISASIGAGRPVSWRRPPRC